MGEKGRDKQQPFYPAKEMKIIRKEDLPEDRRTALLAEEAAHDALPPAV